jgi:hypothetical protein
MNQQIAAVLMMVLCLLTVAGFFFLLRGMPKGNLLNDRDRERTLLERVIVIIGASFFFLGALFVATLLEHAGLYHLSLASSGWLVLDNPSILLVSLSVQIFTGLGLLLKSRLGFYAAMVDLVFIGVTLYLSFGAISLIPISGFFPMFVYLLKAYKYKMFR